MAMKVRKDKNEDLDQEVTAATVSQTELGAGETTTAQKIEGALDEITRSVAGVAELIQENDSNGLPEPNEIDEIEKQLQELNALTQPAVESAGDPVEEKSSENLSDPLSVQEEAAVEDAEALIEKGVSASQAQEETTPVVSIEDLMEKTEPVEPEAVLESAADPIEEKSLEDLSDSLPAQKEAAVEDADTLIEKDISVDQTEEETSPVVNIEDLMENAEPVEPEAVLESAADPIEEKSPEDLSDPFSAQEDAAVEDAEALIEEGVSASQTEEETSPVVSIEDLMEKTEPVDSSVAVEPEAVLETAAPSQFIESEEVQEPGEFATEKRIQEVEEACAPKAEYSKVLVAWHDRGGKVTDEYRSLRTNLLARCRDDRFCLMVTSAEAHEGKTVSCLNLAFVMAERVDQKIVIVDLNLRNGQLAKFLNARPGPGVADYLLGAAELPEILQPTAYPNLFFIPAGGMDHHQPSELLSRSELKRLVGQLRKDYDFVLLDTPAVNQFSDAGMAGLATGDALLVVRMNKTSREAVAQAVGGLRNANVNVVGILMTHSRRRLFH